MIIVRALLLFKWRVITLQELGLCRTCTVSRCTKSWSSSAVRRLLADTIWVGRRGQWCPAHDSNPTARSLPWCSARTQHLRRVGATWTPPPVFASCFPSRRTRPRETSWSPWRTACRASDSCRKQPLACSRGNWRDHWKELGNSASLHLLSRHTDIQILARHCHPSTSCRPLRLCTASQIYLCLRLLPFVSLRPLYNILISSQICIILN